ncbi:hypothetical protein ACFXNW_24800 [Nocardia sp. NPDC059180]
MNTGTVLGFAAAIGLPLVVLVAAIWWPESTYQEPSFDDDEFDA